jgi:hypothetical protein
MLSTVFSASVTARAVGYFMVVAFVWIQLQS